MKTFIWNNGRPQAMKKYNDDLIMACAIGCWVKDIAFTVNQREVEYRKAFLGSMRKYDTTMNTTIQGQQGYKPVKNNDTMKHYQEYSWLIKG